MAEEILYVHSKRSSRLEAGHWLIDGQKLAQLGKLIQCDGGWQVRFVGKEHISPVLGTVDDACVYASRFTGKPVRKVSARQMPRE